MNQTKSHANTQHNGKLNILVAGTTESQMSIDTSRIYFLVYLFFSFLVLCSQ